MTNIVKLIRNDFTKREETDGDIYSRSGITGSEKLIFEDISLFKFTAS